MTEIDLNSGHAQELRKALELRVEARCCGRRSVGTISINWPCHEYVGDTRIKAGTGRTQRLRTHPGNSIHAQAIRFTN